MNCDRCKEETQRLEEFIIPAEVLRPTFREPSRHDPILVQPAQSLYLCADCYKEAMVLAMCQG